MSLDAPPGIAYVSMLAIFSGQGVPLCPRTGERGTIYAAVTAPPGVGKSRTIERGRSTLIVPEGAVLDLNPGSEIGLQEDLEFCNHLCGKCRPTIVMMTHRTLHSIQSSSSNNCPRPATRRRLCKSALAALVVHQ